MRDARALPSTPRPSHLAHPSAPFRLGRFAALRLAALFATLVVSSLGHAPPARAEVFVVRCDALALLTVTGAVSANGEDDLVSLAPGCVYLTPGTVVIGPDNGNAVRIDGRGATLSGDGQRPVLVVNAGGNAYVSDVTLRDGTTNGNGGAVRNVGTLTLSRVTIAGSSAPLGYGGGIRNDGILRIERSTVTDNSSGTQAGGVDNGPAARLTVVESTFYRNFSSYGGAIRNAGFAALFNSTLFGNAGFVGGAIDNAPAGRVYLGNVTISGNDVSGSNGGSLWNDGFADLDNSIVANTGQGVDCVNNAGGTITNGASNLIEDGSCGLIGTTTGDPKLGVPVGEPAYLPLLAGSPAIDHGQNPLCAGTDQRGAPRPEDGELDGYSICDLGAHEASPPIADADGDGAPDETDNCPIVANPDQLDRGGIGASSGPDGIGDACQCGDVNGNGRVTASDATIVARSLLSPPGATLDRPELCHVGGSAGCTLADAAIIRRALLVPPAATIGTACAIPVP